MEDRFGNAFCNDPNETDICRAAEVSKPKKKAKAHEGKKRARTAKGHYVKDDPNTPENEAWVDE